MSRAGGSPPLTRTPTGRPHQGAPVLGRLAAFAAFTTLALGTTAPLWSSPGWPENHEGWMFALRTQVYVRHLDWFDLAPIWSSADAGGFGTPFPLLYHKTFYLLAAVATRLVGSMTTALTATVVLLLITGAAGIYGVVRASGGSRVAAVAAGVSLITANYTVTNWLVRGAFAEFSGAIVMPWVLWGFVHSLQAGRWTARFGVSLAALWLSHTVIAYFTGLLLAATYLLLATARQVPWSFLDPRLAWRAVGIFAALVAPVLIPMVLLLPDYEMTRLLVDPYRPSQQFRDLALYVRDPYWQWGRTWEGYTTALDLPLLVAAGAGGGLALFRFRSEAGAVVRPVLPVLIPGVLALFLQSRAAASFYTTVPGAEFIQFPWRLLALITPALAAVATALVARALPGRAGTAVLGALMIWMVVICGALAPRQYGRIVFPATLDGLSFSAFREYEPRTALPRDAVRPRIEAAWAAAGCVLTARDDASHEVPRVRYDATCERAALLPLPLYASPFHTVQRGNAPAAGCLDLPDFPALCSVSVRAGRSRLQVTLPSLGAVVRRIGGGVESRR